MGVPYSNSLMHDDEQFEYKSEYPDRFRYDYAISREQKSKAERSVEKADEDEEMRQLHRTASLAARSLNMP